MILSGYGSGVVHILYPDGVASDGPVDVHVEVG
jgi:hypothetical protein